ncbi:MAG: hypothetical protein JXR25_14420 [Pontiellaceae bacterium]|nr:hypothetical protein [Pontiellaceae bacterium]MBN2786014.1 hypothetical protein [Pontiellaceae bacterium]
MGRPPPRFLSLNPESAAYFILIAALMLWGPIGLLNAMFLSLLAVPVYGAFSRQGRWWKISAFFTLLAAVAFLVYQVERLGPSGLVFNLSIDSDWNFTSPVVNQISFQGILLIFLPLSFSCAVDRIHHRRNDG